MTNPVVVVSPEEVTADLLDTWRSLQRSAEHLSSPFFSPEFTLAVAAVRPDVRIALLLERSEVVGILPFQSRHRIGRPVAHGLNDCQGVVAAPDLRVDPRDLLAACGLSVLSFDHLSPVDARRWGRSAPSRPNYTMELTHGFDEYVATSRARAPGHFRSLAQKRRKMLREHVVEFRLHDDDPTTLQTLLQWKSLQYRRTGRRDRFSRPWVVALVEALSRQRAAGCAGVLSSLRLDGELAAVHLGLRSPQTVACWFPAHSGRHPAVSPGLQLFLLVAEQAQAQRLDFGMGEEPFKAVLGNAVGSLQACTLAVPSTAAVLHGAIEGPTRAAERFVLTRPELRAIGRRSMRLAGRARLAVGRAGVGPRTSAQR